MLMIKCKRKHVHGSYRVLYFGTSKCVEIQSFYDADISIRYNLGLVVFGFGTKELFHCSYAKLINNSKIFVQKLNGETIL